MSSLTNLVQMHKEEEKARRRQTLRGALQMQAIGHLALAAGHDLGNLVAVMHSYLAGLRRCLHGNMTAENELYSLETAIRTAGEIAGTLASSRPQAVHPEPVRLNELVHETLHMMRLLLPASIRLQEHLEPMTVLWVKADRGQLRQLLLQLTVHARESMPDGGVLGISAGLATSGELARTGGELREGASFVSLKLSDTGAGLPPAAQARTPRSGCLTDLRGLAAAPDLDAGVLPSMAKSCGGYLDVRCVIGRGTTFTLLLPCVRPHAVMESAAPSSPFIAG